MEENNPQQPEQASGVQLILRILLIIVVPMLLAFALNYLFTHK